MDDWLAAALDTVERCWSVMTAVLEDLDPADLGRRPPLPGANSPYAIVHHCVEMSRWWLGAFGCGLDLPRDRSAEFVAEGERAQLLARVEQVRIDTIGWTKQMLQQGVAGRDAQGTTASTDLQTVTPQWVVLHVVHELAQHLGHLQLTRDVLRYDHE